MCGLGLNSCDASSSKQNQLPLSSCRWADQLPSSVACLIMISDYSFIFVSGNLNPSDLRCYAMSQHLLRLMEKIVVLMRTLRFFWRFFQKLESDPISGLAMIIWSINWSWVLGPVNSFDLWPFVCKMYFSM
ncbi:unnamed protein product [Vicia faba]|uniref:Uncharacterized protein n=1 Tax=Vicia faba TaxID=3906 RepID=A0AAV1A520_VICFA|nr:unnamed protein product [Vicia faba]